MDLLANAENWLAGVHKASVSQTVTYQRGAEIISIKATAGQSESASFDRGGMPVSFVGQVWLIEASDLVIGGVTVKPILGDLITHSGTVYRVAAESSGDRPWRVSGANGTVIRVFTKQVR
jgi:broad specificity polyphosphatase/5'/3'-nucleotidase SurE